jgi:hypothetical protein
MLGLGQGSVGHFVVFAASAFWLEIVSKMPRPFTRNELRSIRAQQPPQGLKNWLPDVFAGLDVSLVFGAAEAFSRVRSWRPSFCFLRFR